MSTAETNRSSRWVVVALILVILTSAGAAVVILVSQRASAHSVETLSTSFMREVAARAESVTLAYLGAGPRSLEVIQDLGRSGHLGAADVPAEGQDNGLEGEKWDDVLLEHQFRSLLAAHDEIEMINFGRPNGEFMMVKRMPDSSLSTKRIHRRGGVAESLWHHDNPSWGAEAAYADRREDAASAYDPRTRPWYLSAMERGELSWVDPYSYYSDRKPGIACAQPLRDAGGRLLGVIGTDIGIAELSRLLDTFDIGRSGKAAIVTEDGDLIADPDFLEQGLEIAREVSGSDRPRLVLRRLDDAPDSVLTAAFMARPPGRGEPFTFDHAGTGYVARFESFPLGSERRWIVGVLAPQEDFMGSLRRDHWMTMTVTLLCLFMAIGLAAALVMRAGALEIQLLKARTVEKQHLIDELEARNEEMERFAYTVSHDLKSPLVTIRGYLGMLRKDMAAGQADRVEGDLQRIHAAAGRMGQLLDEVLELSRVGRQVNTQEYVSMSALAREAASNVEGAITQRGVELEVDPKMPPVQGDRLRLLEVFQNLIENAVKFMGDQPQPRIEIGWRMDVSEAAAGVPVFYVRDNGIGIRARYREKIFGLFERLDLGVDGTGVGLALVQRIVKIHGGRVWVESAGPGRGSTFCFTLLPVASA